jgi:cytochrome c-type biogenesis protein
MLAAAQADTTVIAAFAVGFVSFVSPCVLPLVPGYLSAVSGVSVAEMRSGDRHLRRVLGPAIIFCLSFTIMFVALGMTATSIGSALRESKQTLDQIAGVVILTMGVFFVLTPFVGPTLASILAAAGAADRVGHGGVLLAFYALGLAVPFLLTAVAFDRATTAFRWIRDRYLIVTAVSGCVLIFMGVLMLTGQLTELNTKAQQLLSDLGINFFSSV